MSGGNTVVGLWRDADAGQRKVEHLGDVHIATTPMVEYPPEDVEFSPPSRAREIVSSAIAIIAALSWIGAVTWERTAGFQRFSFALGDVTALVAMVSAPLALIAVLWLLMQRSGAAEQRRFTRTAALIDGEAKRLQSLFALIGKRVADSRAELRAQGDELLALGEDAALRLNAVSRAMTSEIENVSRQTQQLTGSAAAARGDLAVLLSSLPKANVETRKLVLSLQDAGLAAHEHAGALDAQLTLLATRGKEANDIAGNAAQRLAAHLARMESVSEVAGARLEEAAGQMTQAVDAALDRAGVALDAARAGMEAQGSAMMALVEQSHAAMARAGDEAAGSLQQRIGEIGGKIDRVADVFARQDDRAQALVARLGSDLDSIEARFADFDSAGSARIERLGMAIQALRGHSEDMTAALSGSGDTANRLAERVESLMTAIDATLREVDETLPAAFARLDQAAGATLGTIDQSSPAIGEMTALASASLERLSELSALVSRQRETLETLSAEGAAGLNNFKSIAAELDDAIGKARADAARLSGETIPQVRDALGAMSKVAASESSEARQALDSLDSATAQRADSARVALSALVDAAELSTSRIKAGIDDAVSQSAATLGARSRQALSDALTGQVETQMTEIAATTERAVAAAQGATDRLMRQMLTISETSASLEARINEAKQGIERSDQANFARRVALLIESLNSTAIDVTKILSNEVTDTAWAAYLRGDRGIFSRRAVRLLDSAQAREIAHNYEHEPEFREQVNRYIHDFESMLRNVLATRDGQLLGVTLLSSDNGKLYVALAQAIERLRT